MSFPLLRAGVSLVPLFAFCIAGASQRSFYTRPDIHGDSVVFTCEGDLWLGSISQHSAHRITSHSGTETMAHFSPDGTQIAFSAQYDGNTDVYVMPVSGDAPKRLTYDPRAAQVLGWTPDGKSILFRSSRNEAHGERRLFTVPAQGGQAQLLPIPAGEFASFAPDGKLAYVPISIEWANWFRYRAGMADKIWLTDLHGKFKKLTDFKGVDTTPVWCGQELYFVSERSGSSNLFHLAMNGAAHQASHYSDIPVRYPSSDGKRIIFQHGPGLGVYDPATQATSELSFELNSDRIHSRDLRVPLAAVAKQAAIGPSGKRIVVEARGQIVSVAAENGDVRVLENTPGARAMLPAWSPDGKQISFISDRSGEYELWISDAGTGQHTRQLTKGLAANVLTTLWTPNSKSIVLGDRNGRVVLVDSTAGTFKTIDKTDYLPSYDGNTPGIAISPDSRFIAFNHGEATWMNQVYVYDTQTGKSARVSSLNVNSQNPAFSTDGKYLLFLSDSQLTPLQVDATQKYAYDNARRVYMASLSPETPSPFLIKTDDEAGAEKAPAKSVTGTLDGLADRVFEVPMPSGRYQEVGQVGSKIFAINLGAMVQVSGSSSGLGMLIAFDVEHKSLTTLSGGVDSFDVSADRKKLLLHRGDSFSVADASGGPTGFNPVNVGSFAVVVQPDKEWHQIFEESWRIARDFFYDPNMHGVDWKKVHAKYEALMPLVGDRTDLGRLQQDLVSELNSGHAYIRTPGYGFPVVSMGYLGADLAPAGDAVKIVHLFRGDGFAGNRSPLLDQGLNVKEGDYIVSIGGQPVRSDQDVQALLVGTVGQTVALGVNSTPSAEGARTVLVQPVGSEAGMRYTDWVQDRNKYVQKHGGPEFGYLHVSDMGLAGTIGFTKGQFPNVLKAGMIYDFRYNGGGYVSSLLLENIAASPQAWFKPRGFETWTRESWANIGHHVALCNEDNFSDGELVIEDWKRMHLGPVIGTRTGGGEVGSGGGYDLIDGGSIYVPNYGAFADGHWIIEGNGAEPDIEVEQDPAEVMKGVDPQLDKAIAVLKAMIAKDPRKKPPVPAFPNKSGH